MDVRIVISWLAFYFFHSLLAHQYIKDTIIAKVPIIKPYYRITYNIISIILFLIGLIEYDSSPDSTVIIFKSTYIGVFIALFGILLLVYSFRNYSISELMIGNPSNTIVKLNVSGLNKYLRHPIYLGTILLLIGCMMILGNLGFLQILIITFIYLPIGIYYEEQKLIHQFGEDYIIYKSKVKAIIPYLI